MKALVVQSHPSYASYNEAILQALLKSLNRSSVDVIVVRVGKGVPLEKVEFGNPDLLILVYPTWWGGYPASLLQWIKEVLAADKKVLSQVRRIISVTTHGSSRLVNVIQGEWGKAYTRRKILPLCHSEAKDKWLSLYKIDRQTPESLDGFLEDVSNFFLQVTES